MTHWPGWVGGLALALVMLLHWFATSRMMAVSGRITAMIDRLRHGKPEDSEEEMTEAELIAALRDQTRAAFGDGALSEEPVAPPRASGPALISRAPQPFIAHPLFFVALALGGLLAGNLQPDPTWLLQSDGFASLTSGSPLLGTVVLVLGGVLVGFGTRMAGGCTSGHGLCGVSRGQRGSLLATCAFFGAGVIASLALGSLW
jgi:uncharacterized membrane protein YedE/YeeE